MHSLLVSPLIEREKSLLIFSLCKLHIMHFAHRQGRGDYILQSSTQGSLLGELRVFGDEEDYCAVTLWPGTPVALGHLLGHPEIIVHRPPSGIIGQCKTMPSALTS